MNQPEYLFKHCIPTGWQTIASTFVIWKDLMMGNYQGYALMPDDDPFQECLDWFWVMLGEDNVYPREFLVELFDIVRQIDSGECELVDVPIADLWEEK